MENDPLAIELKISHEISTEMKSHRKPQPKAPQYLLQLLEGVSLERDPPLDGLPGDGAEPRRPPGRHLLPLQALPQAPQPEAPGRGRHDDCSLPRPLLRLVLDLLRPPRRVRRAAQGRHDGRGHRQRHGSRGLMMGARWLAPVPERAGQVGRRRHRDGVLGRDAAHRGGALPPGATNHTHTPGSRAARSLSARSSCLPLSHASIGLGAGGSGAKNREVEILTPSPANHRRHGWNTAQVKNTPGGPGLTWKTN